MKHEIEIKYNEQGGNTSSDIIIFECNNENDVIEEFIKSDIYKKYCYDKDMIIDFNVINKSKNINVKKEIDMSKLVTFYLDTYTEDENHPGSYISPRINIGAGTTLAEIKGLNCDESQGLLGYVDGNLVFEYKDAQMVLDLNKMVKPFMEQVEARKEKLGLDDKDWYKKQHSLLMQQMRIQHMLNNNNFSIENNNNNKKTKKKTQKKKKKKK